MAVYKQADLFGGAITAQVPADYLDVSDIRQVPDNQEVFLSRAGFSSLTIDICDRVTDQPDDTSALRYHFDDLVDGEDAKIIHVEHPDITLPQLPGIPVLSLVATVTPPAIPGVRPPDSKRPTYTVILFALIRLERQLTDLEVIVNLPNIPGFQELEKEGETVDFAKQEFGVAVDEGLNILDHALRSLNISDWGLFGPGG